MRVAAWLFIACALAGVIGVFVPSVELELGGMSLGRRTSLSLYQASANRELARNLVVSYHRAKQNQVGAAVIAAMAPKAGGRLGSFVGDVRDATETLDDVSAADARTYGTVFTIAVWTFLALQALMAGLVFGDTVQDVYRRRRAIAAAGVAVVVAAFAVAIRLAAGRAVWEANDAVGRTVLGLAPGAYIIPIAGITALASIVTVIVLRHRASRRAA